MTVALSWQMTALRTKVAYMSDAPTYGGANDRVTSRAIRTTRIFRGLPRKESEIEPRNTPSSPWGDEQMCELQHRGKRRQVVGRRRTVDGPDRARHWEKTLR